MTKIYIAIICSFAAISIAASEYFLSRYENLAAENTRLLLANVILKKKIKQLKEENITLKFRNKQKVLVRK